MKMQKQESVGGSQAYMEILELLHLNTKESLKRATMKVVTNSKNLNAEVSYLVGFNAYKIEDKISAELCFKTAVNLDQKHKESLNFLGIIYYEKKDYTKAIEYYNEVLHIDRKHFSALHNIGNSYLELNKYNEAISSYKAALVEKPDHTSSKLNLGIALKNIGQYEEARESYWSISETNRDAKWYINAANVCNKNDYSELASKALQYYKLPKNANVEVLGEFYFNLATNQSKVGENKLAIGSYDSALSLMNPKNEFYIKALINKSATAYNIEDYEESINSAKHAYEIDKKNSFAGYFYAAALALKNSFEEANIVYKNLLEQYPNDQKTQILYNKSQALGESLAKSSKTEKKVESISESIQKLELTTNSQESEFIETQYNDDITIFSNEISEIQKILNANPNTGFKELTQYYQNQKMKNATALSEDYKVTLEDYVVSKFSYYDKFYNICFSKKLGLENEYMRKAIDASKSFAKKAKASDGLIYIKEGIYKIKFGKDTEILSNKSFVNDKEEYCIFDRTITHSSNKMNGVYNDIEFREVDLNYLIDNCITNNDLMGEPGIEY